MDYRDIANRASWTFVQAAAGALVVGQTINAKVALIAGVAAVASLVKNIAKAQLKKK